MKKRVLFLCTANSCRSQMAEGIVNHDLGDRIEAFSAGTVATFVHPLAVRSMQEIGIDISRNRSKGIDEFEGQNFDYVVTLCDAAREACPVYFGGVKRTHLGFDDPAAVAGSDDEKMEAFRRVRDEIREKVVKFFSDETAGGDRDNGDQ